MAKKIIQGHYPFCCDEVDSMSFEEFFKHFQEIQKDIIEEGGFNIFFRGDSIPYEGESLGIEYSRYETDREYEQRLKRDFDEAEKKRIKKIQAEYGNNYILLKDEEFTWEDKAFKVEYVEESVFNGLLDSLKKGLK